MIRCEQAWGLQRLPRTYHCEVDDRDLPVLLEQAQWEEVIPATDSVAMPTSLRVPCELGRGYQVIRGALPTGVRRRVVDWHLERLRSSVTGTASSIDCAYPPLVSAAQARQALPERLRVGQHGKGARSRRAFAVARGISVTLMTILRHLKIAYIRASRIGSC